MTISMSSLETMVNAVLGADYSVYYSGSKQDLQLYRNRGSHSIVIPTQNLMGVGQYTARVLLKYKKALTIREKLDIQSDTKMLHSPLLHIVYGLK